ncbi:MAG: AmmeMemoRadiSam system protein A [bacterium]|nr:AmmeMemoRadiSam system protein A [bacterium]
MEEELTKEERRELLNIARRSVSSYLNTAAAADTSNTLYGLQRKGGVFVTIHKHGNLRGCIGIFTSDKPLYKTVAKMAAKAAFSDPRFPPLTGDELKEIDFEISVLSPLKEIKDTKEIEIGRHGIYVTKGASSGVLLPQVASEQGWDLETFLSHTCIKAGLPTDEWQRGVKIEIFSAQIFSEREELS